MNATQWDDPLLKMDDAMAYLTVSRSTIYRLMWRGDLKGVKVGATWRFRRSALDAALKSAEARIEVYNQPYES